VIVASDMPTCEWDAGAASELVAGWLARGISTHVIAPPGSAAVTERALAALAEAGGSDRVRMPMTQGAFEASLTSVAYGTLESCTLPLDPPVTDEALVEVLVTEDGVESILAPSAASGERQWMLSADGSSVSLVGDACTAATGGRYEGVRVRVACAN
jgi:hypothetical protein